MASYGSSSRMIYNLCKGKRKFHFERKLSTTVGGIANLDGFMESDDSFIFVEAKCREPYGAKSHFIQKKYKDLYEYINNYKTCDLDIKIEETETLMKVDFSVDGLVISYFDIKQMICHLLGIATEFLKDPYTQKITFLYLCYNPELIEISDAKKRQAILSVYKEMCSECLAIDFSKLFESITEYLKKELKDIKATHEQISAMISNFEFILCDQKSFLNYVK